MSLHRYRVTETQFVSALMACVAERGLDFIYPRGAIGWFLPDDTDDPEALAQALAADPFLTHDDTCIYVRSDVDEPACLFGMVLVRCGVTLADLRLAERTEIGDLLADLDLPEPVRYAANEAQQMQDAYATWGEALRRFNDALTESRDDD